MSGWCVHIPVCWKQYPPSLPGPERVRVSFPIARRSKPLNNSGHTYGNSASCKAGRCGSSREFGQATHCWQERVWSPSPFPSGGPAALHFLLGPPGGRADRLRLRSLRFWSWGVLPRVYEVTVSKARLLSPGCCPSSTSKTKPPTILRKSELVCACGIPRLRSKRSPPPLTPLGSNYTRYFLRQLEDVSKGRLEEIY